MTYQIVVGVDGSHHSNAALRWALDEAETHRGDVVAVFVWQMPWISNPGAFDRDEMELAAKKFLAVSVAHVEPSPKVPVHCVVAQGDISEALIAASADSDMLVLGSRGREGFAGLMLGSVSQESVLHAKCPVVVIKRPSED